MQWVGAIALTSYCVTGDDFMNFGAIYTMSGDNDKDTKAINLKISTAEKMGYKFINSTYAGLNSLIF